MRTSTTVAAGALAGLLLACSSAAHDGTLSAASKQLDRPSAERVRADVAQLVFFGTRHTLSDTQSETRGIGAARRWIAAAFERISAQDYGGRLEVTSLPHRVPASTRLPGGAEIVNC